MPINLLLKCHDIETTKAFYKEILDFSVVDSSEDTCTVQKHDCTIIFTTDNLWSGHPKCTGTIYMFIDDVDAYYKSVKDKAIVLWPLQNMSYGIREFGVKDYNEYHIAFAQKT